MRYRTNENMLDASIFSFVLYLMKLDLSIYSLIFFQLQKISQHNSETMYSLYCLVIQ